MAEQDNFDDEEDIVLSELDDGELVEQMHDDLYNGLKEEIEEGTNLLLGRGWSPSRVLDEALVEGMRIVGVDFRDGNPVRPRGPDGRQRDEGGDVDHASAPRRDRAESIGKVVIGNRQG